MRTRRIPPIACPHCGRTPRVRGSEQITPLIREVRYLCDNDECGHSFVATIEIVRTVRPSLRPNAGISLPVLPHLKPANDDGPPAANDDDAPPQPAADIN
ncbi:MAG TPA: ogr/Delta-like zinc finger family protein [Sphingobium sp.]|uniref:ogr/Delta-like zinc finger family protein n=1 Tax=Sphingobium sp. TaxID=1912891 RepID=UPI002ED047FB